MEGREPCGRVYAKLTGFLPKTAGRRTNKEERKRKKAHSDGGKSTQPVTAKSVQQYFLVSESRVKICANLLCNMSARITSQIAILHADMG